MKIARIAGALVLMSCGALAFAHARGTHIGLAEEMAKQPPDIERPRQRCQIATRRAIVGIDLKWPCNSICDIRPGHSWRASIIGHRCRRPRAKLLNDCKCFPYNQLSLRRLVRAAGVAQRVHFGTGTTHRRSIHA